MPNDTIVFTDSLKENSPYIASKPRNHESLFFVTKGSLLYEKDGASAVIPEGQIGYIARGSVDKSSAYLCNEVSYIVVNFCFDRQNPSPKRTLPFNTLCSPLFAYSYEKSFKKLLDCFLAKTPGYIAICNGIIIQIIGQLYNEHKIQSVDFTKMKKIEKATKYLMENYGNSALKISDLANTVNMSEKHFRRIFSDVYNTTPFSFLQSFRIEKGQILLLNTTKSISDIAALCGFSDVYSFSHCFKKHTGVSPGKYKM